MATTTQIVPAKDRFGSMIEFLDKLKPQMKAALPKHLTADRMIRLVLTTLRRSPDLMHNPISLAGAVIQACQIGLEPDGILGEFYLTPRRIHGEWACVGIPGYRGLMKLARQSGEVEWIMPHAVYVGDDFVYEYGSNPKLVHKPGPGPNEDARITHFYAVAKLRSGSPLFWAMPRADVDRVRDTHGAREGAWKTHYLEMGMKTPVRRLCKFLPQSPALGRAISLDELAEAGLPQGLDALVDTDELGIKPMKRTTLDTLTDALTEKQEQKAGNGNGQGNGHTTAPAAGAEPVERAGSPESSSASAPSSPTPVEAAASQAPASAAPAPLPRRPRQFPRTVEKPVAPPVAALDPPAPEPEPDPPPEPETPAAAAELTATNVFDLIKGCGTDAAVDALTETIYLSEIFRRSPDHQKRLIREALSLQRRRLTSAA